MIFTTVNILVALVIAAFLFAAAAVWEANECARRRDRNE